MLSVTTRRRWLGQTRPPDMDVAADFPPGLRCGGTEMPAWTRRAWGRRAAFVAAGLFAVFSLVSSAGAVAPPARLHGLPAAELFSKARVVCETRQEGRNSSNVFLQRWANVRQRGRHVEMPLAGARRNELRHLPRQSEARFGLLHRSGDLMPQSACVNRVNAEYLKCIPGCH